MRCLRCTDQALPDKALCAHCYPQWVAECQARSKSLALMDEERAKQDGEPLEIDPAPVVPRALAALFDLTFLMTLSWTIIWPVMVFSGITTGNIVFLKNYTGDAHVFKLVYATALLLLKITCCCYILPAWIYFAIFELSPLRATPGKLMMGLRVYRAGDDLSFAMVSKRFFFKLLPFLLPSAFIPGIYPVVVLILPQFLEFALIFAIAALAIASVLDPLFVLMTKSGNALHDFFSDTEVVRVVPIGFSRMMVCFFLSAMNVAIHSSIWGNPLLKLSASQLLPRW